MRAAWKPFFISPNLGRVFFKINKVAHNRSWNSLWYQREFQDSPPIKDNLVIVANRSDFVLPIYRNTHIALNRGNRFNIIHITAARHFFRFGSFGHTKKYSPIHRGTEFRIAQRIPLRTQGNRRATAKIIGKKKGAASWPGRRQTSGSKVRR